MASINKGILSLFVIFTIFVVGGHGMTPEEMKGHAKVIKEACMAKNPGVTEELIAGMKQHIYPDDHNLKCFVLCGMEASHTMKDGKVDYEAALKIIDEHAPAEAKPLAIAALDKCRSAGDGMADPCDVAYAVVQCICKEKEGILVNM